VKGFTLIEMIGVLAVIAILASLLIPKIFEAINNARISNTAVSINTLKTALADHYAKFCSLASTNGIALTIIPGPGTTNFDNVLLGEGFLDKPFQVKIGDVNNNGQEFVEATPRPSTTHRFAKIWRMKCHTCKLEYGCNSCDAHLRQCPSCHRGAASPEPLP
jgi:prepilin-type N-terminal cleavage/methylation domain-containing protein